jgi:hypothetical protein
MFKTANDATTFIFAGNATITLSSERTGAHFTYKIRASDDGRVFFVKLLIQPNEYAYLGCIFSNARGSLHLSAKSCASDDAPSVRAINYALRHLLVGVIAPQLEIRHEGSCGRCGRPLTVPSSIDRGIGPDCAALMCVAA